MKQLKGYLFIAIAATLWGASATIVKHLFNIQYPPLIIVQTRVSIAFVVLAVFFLVTNPRILAFRMRDVPHFFFVGVCGIAGSNYFYYFAIKESNVATAIVVQYSAPIMVALYAIVVQHEKMTRFKLLSLIFSTAGIFLAVGGLNGLLVANHKGIVLALAAAVSYAIFNLAGKPLTKKYSVWSSLVFTLGAATLFWLVVQPPQTILAAGYSFADWKSLRSSRRHRSWFRILLFFWPSVSFSDACDHHQYAGAHRCHCDGVHLFGRDDGAAADCRRSARYRFYHFAGDDVRNTAGRCGIARMKSEKRTKKIFSVLSKRQPDLTIVMENIHDPHNVSAMLRSADAVGIHEVQLVYTKEKFPRVGKKSSSSANKWVERRKFDSLQSCYERLHSEGFTIYATRLDESSRPLYSFDLTAKTAFVFGNEHAGVSDEAAALADAVIMIPMMGMIQSLNVSVACAVALYEALRQRIVKDKYGKAKFSKPDFDRLYAEWMKK